VPCSEGLAGLERAGEKCCSNSLSGTSQPALVGREITLRSVPGLLCGPLPGRNAVNRTPDLLLPKQARYHYATFRWCGSQLGCLPAGLIMPPCCHCQAYPPESEWRESDALPPGPRPGALPMGHIPLLNYMDGARTPRTTYSPSGTCHPSRSPTIWQLDQS
jgi:hypothetical protein